MKLWADKLNSRLLDILPDLRRFALSLARNPDEADDLVQEASLRVLRSDVPDDANLRRWAFRVCKNIWIDKLRAKKVRQPLKNGEEEYAVIGHDGEAELEGRSELDRVLQLMAAMPENQQVALSLVAIDGMSYREAADVMEVPIGTVMSRVSRARAFIADALQCEQERNVEND